MTETVAGTLSMDSATLLTAEVTVMRSMVSTCVRPGDCARQGKQRNEDGQRRNQALARECHGLSNKRRGWQESA